MTQREIQALLRNGHLPIPVQGKRPFLQNWQNFRPDEEMIARWGDQGDNTGVLCKRTAALDIDFDDAAAVQIVLEVVRDRHSRAYSRADRTGAEMCGADVRAGALQEGDQEVYRAGWQGS